MKRKWFIYLGAASLAVGVTLNVNLSKSANSQIDLALRNVEVLARNEGNTHTLTCEGTWGICRGECGVHQIKMTKTGRDDTAIFTCSD